MQDVKIELDEQGQGAFNLMDDGQKAGEMVVGIEGSEMKVYHTEVEPEWEGQGLSKKMLEAMVAYARENKLQVIPLCSYVQVQFKRHAEEYADIWKQTRH